VPVKGGSYKTRLSKSLGERERSRLSVLLLRDLLDTIAKTGRIADTFVVSSNRKMVKIAQLDGARGILERRDAGVDAAVELALRSLGEYDACLVLPSDLPLLKPSDIRRAIRLKEEGPAVVVSPSASFDGTNLLLFSRPLAFKLSYDNDSFWNHVRNAAAVGASLAVYATRGVMTDVDTVRDVDVVTATRMRRRSIAFLRKASRPA
jgi:2-phospho-L-lactate guanylyltransferase